MFPQRSQKYSSVEVGGLVGPFLNMASKLANSAPDKVHAKLGWDPSRSLGDKPNPNPERCLIWLLQQTNYDMVNVSSLCILKGYVIGGVTHSFNNKHQKIDLNRHPMRGHNAIGFYRKWKYSVPGSWAWENRNTWIPEREIKHKNNPFYI